MVKKQKRLTSFEKGRIVQLKSDGNSTSIIMKTLKRARSTINKFLSRIKAGGNIERTESTGRKRKTTTREDSLIARQAQKSRKVTCASIRQDLNLQKVSLRTIQRRVIASGQFDSTWTKKKPFVSDINRANRVQWCKDHLKWTVEQWRNVLWSDESSYVLRYNRRIRCYRRKGEKYNPELMQGSIKHDKKIMVWGCFAACGVGNLHRITGIMDKKVYQQILIHHMRPSGSKLFGSHNYVFQQDNDPKHTARTVKDYFRNKRIHLLSWPAQSPDLNPIENLWSTLDSKCRERRPQNEKELFTVLENAWKRLPRDLLTNLVDSMPRRCAEVIKSKGYPISY